MSTRTHHGGRRTNEISTVWTDGVAGQRNWIRNVGHGGMDWFAGCGIARFARTCDRSRLQFFRYRMGLRRRTQRRAAWQGAARERRKEIVCGDEGAAKESAVAVKAGVHAG